jgi:hypothetical protein
VSKPRKAPDDFYALFRTSHTFHISRPKGGSARIAWDHLSKYGPITSMRLLDGWWMCRRPDGEVEEGIEAVRVLQIRRKQLADKSAE